jgi:hypothetical protein
MIIPRIQDLFLSIVASLARCSLGLFPFIYNNFHVQLERLFYRSSRIAVLDCG